MGHFFLMYSHSFSKLAAYITHNAIQPLSDIAGGNSSVYMIKLLPLEPHKALHYLFLFFTFALVIPNTYTL